MKTETYRIYGAFGGHRQAISFSPSVRHVFHDERGLRILDIRNSDKTGTNMYTELEITADDPDRVMAGQESDGIFENYRTGKIEKLINGAWVEYNLY